MKLIQEQSTVVLVGSFNPAILTPSWVARYGLGYSEKTEFRVELLTAVSGAIGTQRFSFDGISYEAGFNQVTFHLKGLNASGRERVLGAICGILRELPHTPIVGVGVNFGFAVDEPSAEVLAMLSASSDMADAFPGGSEVVSRTWSNTFQWDRFLVNFSAQIDGGGQVALAANFHHNAKGAREAVSVLSAPHTHESFFTAAKLAASAFAGEGVEEP